MESSILVKVIALAMAVLILGGICVVMKTRTTQVRLCTCVFVVSLVSTQLLMKQLGSQFKFPGLVTALHFLSAWICCILYWVAAGDWSKLLPHSLGSSNRYFRFVLPIAISMPLSVIFNNMALIYIGAGLNGILSTTAPITTAMLSHMMGRRIPPQGWFGVSVAGVGAFIIGFSEFRGSTTSTAAVTGIILAAFAVLLRSSKVVMQDQLLEPAAYNSDIKEVPAKSLSPMHVWALQAPPCTLVALAFALSSESLLEAWAQFSPRVAGMTFATCVSATVLNLLGMYTIKELGASSMQIVGKLNTIILVSLSVAFLGETLLPTVIVGACFVLAGIGIFETVANKAKEELPTNMTRDPSRCSYLHLGVATLGARSRD